jgi:hypothetical protein
MRLASVETSYPAAVPSQFPIRLVQTPSTAGAILKLFILLPTSIALLTPFVLVAIQLATNPGSRMIVSEHPQTGILLALALACWAGLLAWPVKRLASTVARLRTVSIFNNSVQVADSNAFGQENWRQPVQAFAGIAHNIRTSLSGVRHELVLVHPDRHKSVLLAMAPSFSQSDVDAMCRLLNTREVSSKLLYGIRLSPPTAVGIPQAVPLRSAA